MWSRLEKYLRDITFNIRREREIDLNRRGFVASSLALVGLMFVSSFPFAARAGRLTEEEAERETLRIAGPNELGVGESKVFAYPDEDSPALLVRLSEKEYRSYNIKCTHLQCPVYWDRGSGRLACPCHNGYFSVEDGSVLAGPPPRALPSIRLAFRGDGIYAVGIGGGVIKGDQH